MPHMTDAQYRHICTSYPQGTRIQLVSTSDPYSKTRPGDKGTVIFVDAQGTLIVDWDNGTSLNVILREDVIKKL